MVVVVYLLHHLLTVSEGVRQGEVASVLLVRLILAVLTSRCLITSLTLVLGRSLLRRHLNVSLLPLLMSWSSDTSLCEKRCYAF